jgi:hypothetical protein
MSLVKHLRLSILLQLTDYLPNVRSKENNMGPFMGRVLKRKKRIVDII